MKFSTVERVVTDPLGNVLDVTRLGYEFSAAQKHAIEVRDGTCCFAGCTAPAQFCDTDHLVPYAAGGPTTASNAKKWCRRHHRMKGFGVLPTPYDGPPPDTGPASIRRRRLRADLAHATAGRTQDIDLEPIPVPWAALGIKGRPD